MEQKPIGCPRGLIMTQIYPIRTKAKISGIVHGHMMKNPRRVRGHARMRFTLGKSFLSTLNCFPLTVKSFNESTYMKEIAHPSFKVFSILPRLERN